MKSLVVPTCVVQVSYGVVRRSRFWRDDQALNIDILYETDRILIELPELFASAS
jgi:hypothetical protein